MRLLLRWVRYSDVCHSEPIVVYFDQRTLENHDRFSSCVSHEPFVRMMEKVLFSSFSNVFHRACVRWLKYTTTYPTRNKSKSILAILRLSNFAHTSFCLELCLVLGNQKTIRVNVLLLAWHPRKMPNHCIVEQISE